MSNNGHDDVRGGLAAKLKVEDAVEILRDLKPVSLAV